LTATSADPVEWGAELTGKFSSEADGKTFVVFQAAPPQGPTFIATVTCPGLTITNEMPGGSWNGESGHLANGVYDYHVDLPLGSKQTGTFYQTVHMEQSQKK
jgi:hypothetical protein